MNVKAKCKKVYWCKVNRQGQMEDNGFFYSKEKERSIMKRLMENGRITYKIEDVTLIVKFNMDGTVTCEEENVNE